MATDWQLDGTTITTTVAETRTAKRLTLTWRTDLSTVTDHLRPLRDEAGKFETVVDENGQFAATDLTERGIGHTLTPPDGRNTLRQSGTYYPAEYRERVVDQQANKYEVTVEWQADASRETTTATDETAGANQWRFGFSSAAIATQRVAHDRTDESPAGVRRTELSLVLAESQAKVLEESAAYLDAVQTREVADGSNAAFDASETGRNTVTVTEPANGGGDFLRRGTYLVETWETEWLNDAFFRVTLALLERSIRPGRLGEAPLGEFKLGEA